MANSPASSQDHPAMDYAEHERTFAGFIKLSKIATVVVILIMVFMAVTLL